MTTFGARRSYRIVRAGNERRAARLVATMLVGIAASACSMSFPIASFVADEPVTTESTIDKTLSPLSPELGQEDWRRAKGVLAIALDPQGSGTQVSWDNPDTAMKGSFTPVGQPFVKADEICRAFLATVAGQASTSHLQGTACRPSGGEWIIKEVKPFRKTS